MRDPFAPTKAPTPSGPCSPSSTADPPRRRRRLYVVALAATALVFPALLFALVPASPAAASLRSPISILTTKAGPPPPPPQQLTLFDGTLQDDSDSDSDSYANSTSGTCLVGRCSRYSFDATSPPLQPTWMSRLPDSTPLTSLSLPGTHDTMTYSLERDVRLRCQNWDLAAQLEAGVRYVDIRARLRDDELRIYHAEADTGHSLVDVLRVLFAFLDHHPSEAVVMRLKQEGPALGHGNTLSFEQVFERYRHGDSRTAPGAARHLHRHRPRHRLPDLGALRGKVFLLQEFAAPDAGPYGLAWDGPQMALEDMWVIPDVYHLADKWIAIRSALERAATDPLDNSRLYLAHVSASVGVLPVDAAAGPRNRSVTGMNDMTAQWLLDFDRHPDVKPRVGIVIFDFPGRRAIDAVIAWNKVPASP